MNQERDHSPAEGFQTSFFSQVDAQTISSSDEPGAEGGKDSMPASAPVRGGERRKKPPKVPTLQDLYLEAVGHYYETIAEELAASGKLGEQGITEEDVEDHPEFMSIEAFRRTLIEQGIQFRDPEAQSASTQAEPPPARPAESKKAAPPEPERNWTREWTTSHGFYDTRSFRPELSVEEMITMRPLEGWRAVTDQELKALKESGAVASFAYVNGLTCVRDPDNYFRFQDGTERLTWPFVAAARRVVGELRRQGLSDDEIKGAWLTAMPRQFREWEKYLWDQLNGFYQNAVGGYFERAKREQELEELGKVGTGRQERDYFLSWVDNAVGEYEWYASYPRLLGEEPKPLPEWLSEMVAYADEIRQKEASG